MKVLISGSFWHGSLEESYARAFESMGWQVVRFDWDKRAERPGLLGKLLRLRIANKVGEDLIASVRSERPDFVFVMKGKWVSPDTLTALKKELGTLPLINFNPDSPWEPGNSSKRLLASIPIYDYHFTWSSHLKQRFKDFGAKNVDFLPFAYDPKLHFPVDSPDQKWQFDAIFLGTYSGHRDKLLSQVVGCKVAIWGNDWERSKHVPKDWLKGKAIYGEASTRLMSLAPAAINILRPQNAGSHNMRTFEIPATRNAMLTTRSEEQSLWFAEGKEMECFSDPKELVEKIGLLKENPQHAREVAEAGYERVREETYAKRARQILSVLGFAS
jgi:spore maturation protein CgeB